MENSTHTNQISLWNFLSDHTVEIPIIQRDYAQGRKGKEALRKTFLKSLKDALDTNNALTLDFVYGSSVNGPLNPLDGQQRLTTLWLLHWYVAYKAGELTNPDVAERLKKFTYETRISSREFCEKLVTLAPLQQPEMSIARWIQQQTWFYSSWKQDPTIQSMLRMLSGDDGKGIADGCIEKVFATDNYQDWWSQLTKNCLITFYYLDLVGLNLSDDLYIKMNARGEPLTSFENFKADLVGYIREQATTPSQESWNSLSNDISKKFDTEWTDVFWKNQKDGRIDEIYFAFLNRFFWNELFIAKEDVSTYILKDIDKPDENISYRYLNDSANNNSYDAKIAYIGLEVYKYFDNKIPFEFFKKLTNVLNRYNAKVAELVVCPWDKEFWFIPKYVEKDDIIDNAGTKIKQVTTLNQVQRVAFFAVCKYLSEGEYDETSLKRWMRVVWNLVSGKDRGGNPQIRSTGAMRRSIEFIEGLNSHDVYESLSGCSITGTYDFDLRCKEEIEKAKQIEEDASCEQKIIKAEQYAFFNGSIRFLFQAANGNVNWEDFDTKFENAKLYFDKIRNFPRFNGAVVKYFIAQCTSWNQLYDEQLFLNTDDMLRYILTNSKWCNPIHQCLTATITDIRNCNKALYDISAPDGPAVRDELVDSGLIDVLLKGHSNFRLKWNNNMLALYAPYGRDAVTIGTHRNSILSDLLLNNTNTLDPNLIIPGCKFFWGWDIPFKYNNRDFEWNSDGKIYRIDSDGNYLLDNDNKYIFYEVQAKADVNNITAELDKL